MTVPSDFAVATIAREGEAGRRWVESLPELAAELLEHWACTEPGPVLHGFVGVVVPALRADGTEVVLKLAFPSSANTAEPVALSAWQGNGGSPPGTRRQPVRDAARTAAARGEAGPGPVHHGRPPRPAVGHPGAARRAVAGGQSTRLGLAWARHAAGISVAGTNHRRRDCQRSRPHG
ncbi:hypothetical protein QRX50_11930 [Amycolatopsis carbonis]|uniref:Uncharacterized protein n=1 Tax=Amycolatopsis carbonis TaxID=715471 RepID=A0A9Y2IMM7_9PSEU|nr:hypothetical protein [Amycolatopsis sp. 2-15]WIX81408.1 hypothetical protein QRX50_11930 [Amycolatopsis sp. 2-15]